MMTEQEEETMEVRVGDRVEVKRKNSPSTIMKGKVVQIDKQSEGCHASPLNTVWVKNLRTKAFERVKPDKLIEINGKLVQNHRVKAVDKMRDPRKLKKFR